MSEGRKGKAVRDYQFDKNLVTRDQLNDYFDMKEIKKMVAKQRKLSSQQEINENDKRQTTSYSHKVQKKKKELKTQHV